MKKEMFYIILLVILLLPLYSGCLDNEDDLEGEREESLEDGIPNGFLEEDEPLDSALPREEEEKDPGEESWEETYREDESAADGAKDVETGSEEGPRISKEVGEVEGPEGPEETDHTTGTARLRRYFGADRYQTAVHISREGWSSASTVVLARGDHFPDSLAGAPLAYHHGSPLLLTRPGEIPRDTVAEIDRLGAESVLVLGEEEAVSEEVVKAVEESTGVEAKRIGGRDRYHTSALVAQELEEKAEKAVVVKGSDYKDALVASPYAARSGHPLLLVEPERIPESVLDVLQQVSRTVLVGDGLEELKEEVPEPLFINNPDHYSNAVEFIETHPDVSLPEKAVVTTGESFPDALTGGVLAARQEAQVFLVDDAVPREVEDFLSRHSISNIDILGGPEAVNKESEEKLREVTLRP